MTEEQWRRLFKVNNRNMSVDRAGRSLSTLITGMQTSSFFLFMAAIHNGDPRNYGMYIELANDAHGKDNRVSVALSILDEAYKAFYQSDSEIFLVLLHAAVMATQRAVEGLMSSGVISFRVPGQPG